MGHAYQDHIRSRFCTAWTRTMLGHSKANKEAVSHPQHQQATSSNRIFTVQRGAEGRSGGDGDAGIKRMTQHARFHFSPMPRIYVFGRIALSVFYFGNREQTMQRWGTTNCMRNCEAPTYGLPPPPLRGRVVSPFAAAPGSNALFCLPVVVVALLLGASVSSRFRETAVRPFLRIERHMRD